MNQKGVINIIFIAVIVILLGVVGWLVLIRQSGAPTTPSGSQSQTQLSAVKPIIENKLSRWINAWQKVVPEFNISTFRKIRESSVVEEEYPYDPVQNKLREILYVYSPDKTKVIDPYVYMYLFEEGGKVRPAFEPDSAVGLIDLESKKWKQVLMCGTPCGFDDVTWIDNNTFVVVGNSEYYPESGEERCSMNTKCTYVATLYIFDLSKNKLTLYYGPESERRPSSYLQNKFPNIDFD